MNLTINGAAYYLPELTISNEALSGIIDTSDEWIRTRTGIRRRHYVNGENCWELGARAVERLLAKTGVKPSEIDGVLLTSCSPDYYTPAMATLICHELGLTPAFAYDINVACSGFIYALDLAGRYLQDAEYKKILIVSAEAMSRMLDFSDRTSCVLFGDGAGAVLVERGEGEVLSTILRTKADSVDAISHRAQKEIRHPFGQEQRTTPRTMANERDSLYLNGSEVYRYAVQELVELAEAACKKAGITMADIDLFIPHQANQRIIHAAAKHSAIPEEKVVVMLEDTGNLSSASIPYCLSRLVDEGRLKRGMTVLLCGFGSGLSSGAMLMRW